MDHQDILDLIHAGDTSAAESLIRGRIRRNGISGHDQQTLITALGKAHARAAQVTVKILTVPPVATVAKPPSKTPGRTRRRKE